VAETDTPGDVVSGPIAADETALRLERALRTSLGRLELMAQTSILEGAAVAVVALPERAGADGAGARAILRAIHGDVLAFLSPRTASIGVGRVCREPEDLRRGYQEAVQALRSHQRLGLSGGIAEYDRLGVERILTQLPDRHELARYADDVLGPLVAYDAAHGSELVPTLEANLAHGGRQRVTAEALGIHVNSLQYRLRRIQEIGEVDLEDPETRLNLHLALRTLQVLRALDPRT
jgi:sugar diacid utilization regulator